MRIEQSNGQWMNLARLVVTDIHGTVLKRCTPGQTCTQSVAPISATASSTYTGSAGPNAMLWASNGAYAYPNIHHSSGNVSEWWECTLKNPDGIKSVKLINRSDCCQDRVNGAVFKMFTVNDMGVESLAFSTTIQHVGSNEIMLYDCRL